MHVKQLAFINIIFIFTRFKTDCNVDSFLDAAQKLLSRVICNFFILIIEASGKEDRKH